MSKKERDQMAYARHIQREIEVQLRILEQFGGDPSGFRNQYNELMPQLCKVIAALWGLEDNIFSATKTAWLKREAEKGETNDQERD